MCGVWGTGGVGLNVIQGCAISGASRIFAIDTSEAKLEFARTFGVTFASIPDAPPYPVSSTYGVRTVPTLFLVDGGTVLDVVESWDRDGYNRVSHGLAELIGADASTVSTPDDGLPPFRPG